MDRRNGSLGVRDDDDDDDDADDDDDNGCTTCFKKWRVKLIFQHTYKLSGTRFAECFEIIDVG